jgi:hypothetical protein
MAKAKVSIIYSEGFPQLPADPIFGAEALKELGKGKYLWTSMKLPRIHKFHSRISAARRRYVYGDDSALDET